jgi:surface antigen
MHATLVTTLLVDGVRGMLYSARGGGGQVIPFAGNFGQGLAPSDNQMIFQSVARLNAVEPSKVGQSDSWSNPETKSSGTSTILRVFHSGGMACHLMRHHIVAGRPPPRDYRFTWCRTPSGEWKIKS